MGQDGKLYTTSTGLLPYRKLDYKFQVQVFALTDITLANPLSQVIAGDSVILRLTPQKADGTLFTNRVEGVSNWTQSGAKLIVPPFGPADTAISYPNGVTGPTNREVMFTKVPNGGLEYVYASGVWTSTTDTTQKKAFIGVSEAIRILAGTAAVAFQNPQINRNGKPGKKLIEISCFDLQGRRIFHGVTETFSGLIQAKDFQHLWKNRIASGAFIVRMSIQEDNSKACTSLNMMATR
jgi:hypothetical protein